jgi:diadenosine tetraphosphate (Ap4A) HIT family hydrolase
MSVVGCLACDATTGRVEVPGGVIVEGEHWRAEHCLGPFGVGAVVVKTKEHVESLWELPDAAAAELGPFLRRISGAIVDGLGAQRAYLTMWVDKPPLHVHMVVYPRWPDEAERGPAVDQMRYFAGPPPADAASAAAETLRAYLSSP